VNAFDRIFGALRTAKSAADYGESVVQLENEKNRIERELDSLIAARESVILSPQGDITGHEAKITAARSRIETLDVAIAAATKKKTEADAAEARAKRIKDLRKVHADAVAQVPVRDAAYKRLEAHMAGVVEAADQISALRPIISAGNQAASDIEREGEECAALSHPPITARDPMEILNADWLRGDKSTKAILEGLRVYTQKPAGKRK
jgi:hypothetical protein